VDRLLSFDTGGCLRRAGARITVHATADLAIVSIGTSCPTD
jgi:hypothetical protein